MKFVHVFLPNHEFFSRFFSGPRVAESLATMMGMGFSNEGGWLAQLLENVDGSIINALDLLQPSK